MKVEHLAVKNFNGREFKLTLFRQADGALV